MERFTGAAFGFEVTDTPAAGRGGPGGAVILVHGFPQDRRCWDRVTPVPAGGGYRVLAPDLRGYPPGAPAGLVGLFLVQAAAGHRVRRLSLTRAAAFSLTSGVPHHRKPNGGGQRRS